MAQNKLPNPKNTTIVSWKLMVSSTKDSSKPFQPLKGSFSSLEPSRSSPRARWSTPTVPAAQRTEKKKVQGSCQHVGDCLGRPVANSFYRSFCIGVSESWIFRYLRTVSRWILLSRASLLSGLANLLENSQVHGIISSKRS